MKVKEIIKVPSVETVIQLSSVLSSKDRKKLLNLIETFVVTDEVYKNFEKFFRGIMDKAGSGYFLKGSYGSGKSHFLSAISLLLQHHDMWEFIIKQNKEFKEIYNFLLNKKYLAIKVPLILYRAEENLEQILLKSIEKEFEEQNINVNLSDANKVVTDFFNVVSKKIQDQFRKFLKDNNITDFELSSNEKKALLIKEFTALKSIPFQFFYDREDAFRRILDIMEKNGYSGMIILIDELSEFLRSKSSSVSLDEDIRFLQFLGELSLNDPVWIIGAIQEEIREISNISNKIFTKIKDRYKNRLELTTLHLEELLEKRLIIKKPGNSKALTELYGNFIKSFSLVRINKERFIRIYPLINPTLNILESVTSIFSKQRGIVDFIHFQIKGDKKRGIKGILNEEYDTFITPDKIFDHFENNIQEYIDTNPYYETVFKYYLKNIPSYFSEQKERALAIKIIKILILLKSGPSISPQSVKSIVNMLMYKFSSTDPMLNYEYIYENIIKKFIYQMNYVIEEKKENFTDNLISISIEVNLNIIIDNKMKLTLQSFEKRDETVIEALLNQTRLTFLDVENLMDREYQHTTFYQNTAREGFITVTDLFELSGTDVVNFNRKILKQDKDFFIIIGKPGSGKIDIIKHINSLLKDTDFDIRKNFLFWVPAQINKDKISALKKYYAFLLILEEYKKKSSEQDKKIKEIIAARVENEKVEIRNTFQNSYAGGTFISADSAFRKPEYELLNSDFERLMKDLTGVILDIKYPGHHKIMPHISSYNQFQFQNLIKYFFKATELSFEEANRYNVLPIIEGILIPLQLAQKQGRIFYLKIRPDKSEFLVEYLSLLNNGPVLFNEVYLHFKKGAYGINKTIFLLITAALISAGLIMAEKNNKAIDIDKFDFYSIEIIDMIYPGEIVDAGIQNKLFALNSIFDKKLNKEIFTIDTQNQVWENIVNLKKVDYLNCVEFEQKIENLSNYSIFQNNDIISSTKQDLKEVIEILNNIKVSYNSNKGIETFIQSIPDVETFGRKILFIRLFTLFIKYNFQEYIFSVNYLNKTSIPDKYTELFMFKESLIADLTNFNFVIKENNFDIIKEKFNQFQENYIKLYEQEHERHYNIGSFQKLLDIKKSIFYEIFKKISMIKFISIENDFNRFENIMNQYYNQRCSRLNIEDLRSSITTCGCGFKIGDRPVEINLSEIKKLMEKGIIDYLNELRSKENLEKLTVYIIGLKKINKKDMANNLEEIIKLKTGVKFDRLITKLKYLITYDVIDEINKALMGERVIVEREINELTDKIVDKNIPRKKLIKLFHDWLEGEEATELHDDLFIFVVDKKKAVKLIPAWLKEGLNRIFPLIEILKAAQAFLIINWLSGHKLDIEKNISLILGTGVKNIDVEQVIKLYKDHKDEIETEKFISLNISDDLLNMLEINNKDIDQLMTVLNRELMFDRIRIEIGKKIIEKIISREIVIKDIDEKINYKDDISNAVITAGKIIFIKQQVAKIKNKNDICEWVEKKYLPYISKYELLIGKLSEYNLKYSLIPRAILNSLSKGCEKNIAGEEEFFKERLKQESDLKTLSNWKSRKIDNNINTAIFLFDGMRWDLWKYFKSILLKHDVKILHEDYQFALPPTDTLHQRFAIFHGEYKFDLKIKEDRINTPAVFGNNVVWINCAEYDYKKSIIEDKIRNKNIIILGFNFIDDKLHNQKFGISIFYEELKIIFQEKVIPLLQAMSRDYSTYIISDHGFKSQLNWQRRGEYRYLHGADSPYEVILPDIKIKMI